MNNIKKMFIVGLWMTIANHGMSEFQLFDKNGAPHKALIHILRLVNIEHDNSIQDIVNKTQKQWLRQTGKERWEIEKKEYGDHDKIASYFDELHLIKEIIPEKTNYEYAFFLGGTVGRMKLRLDYMINLWKKGFKFKTLVILAGQRPLDKNANEFADLCNFLQIEKHNIATESDALNALIKKYLPEEVAQVVFVDVPMKKDEKTGAMIRPTTDDTIIQWQKDNPDASGDCLVISNQPFVLRQALVVQKNISKNCKVYGAGEAQNEKTLSIQVIFDELARLIFTEYQTFFQKIE